MEFGMIGCGKMGQALLGGILSAGIVKPESVRVYDPVAEALSSTVDTYAVNPANNNEDLVAAAEVVLLCVKPHHALGILWDVAPKTEDTLFISIVAGISISDLEAAAGPGNRVVRVMPNTPALIGKGASAFAPGTSATASDINIAIEILSAVGQVIQVEERLLDAVTGLSGSGPAYVYRIIDAMAEGGLLMGLPKDKALLLAAQTVAGAAEMVLQTNEHPAVLTDMVTSPGGTTAAGLATMEKHGVRSAMIEAVRAATTRSHELGQINT